jgi:hypothetical protein
MESEAELAFAVRCCTITVHVYDAVVMGAGKAGLSAS